MDAMGFKVNKWVGGCKGLEVHEGARGVNGLERDKEREMGEGRDIEGC